MDSSSSAASRGCTRLCYGRQKAAVEEANGVQRAPASLSGAPCKKGDGVAARLINGVSAAFFISLERCSCVIIDTKGDSDQDAESSLAPLVIYNHDSPPNNGVDAASSSISTHMEKRKEGGADNKMAAK